MTTHPAIHKSNVAVVTGAASGIGLAIAAQLGGMGLKVCLADLPNGKLESAAEAVRMAGAAAVLVVPTDVADPAALRALEARVTTELGPVSVLVNNAGIQPGSSIFDAECNWQRIIDVNMWGVIRGSQIFAPGMIAAGNPGLIVSTGSKQGITTPPGDPAYNVSKTGVKTFTEALQHELRNIEGCQVEARLFIPGFVFTPLTAGDRTEKPAGAWTPEQVADFLLDALGREDFYILCPDGEIDRRTDEKRIAWSAGDIIENRPPLSRWHPEYGATFQTWLES
jgi:hypothetical protein